MIIDHLDKLELSDDTAGKYFNELHSLDYLAQGLRLLYENVQMLEAKISEVIGHDKQVFIFGNYPELSRIPQGLVACTFHWYAVTVYNYVRMVGWLTHEQNPTNAREYVKRVIPAVYVWRNKVAAHFAITDPREEDSPADLAMSVMFPISFYDDAFYAGLLRLSVGKSGKSSTSRRDIRWSLTHTHRELITRYWPTRT